MSWQNCKNILVIRPDNMGDLIMSTPAIRALKQTLGAHITILTSSMAANIVPFIAEIDDAIIFDVPWVKTDDPAGAERVNQIVEKIKSRHFDGAVIFTVFSQNPLPTAVLAYLSGIPRVLAYCRENPYHLVTDWVPDKEPFQYIKHQVQRDLDLVATVGAFANNDDLSLTLPAASWHTAKLKLEECGFDLNKQWLVLHAGVSEPKRRYPVDKWIDLAKQLIQNGYNILFTGSVSERPLTDYLASYTGSGSLSGGGLFSLDELIAVINKAPLVLSVNTGTVHIAAALKTPCVVLYARTNPQHTPWKTPSTVLQFDVPGQFASQNEILQFLNRTVFKEPVQFPDAKKVVAAVKQLLSAVETSAPPTDLIHIQSQVVQAS